MKQLQETLINMVIENKFLLKWQKAQQLEQLITMFRSNPECDDGWTNWAEELVAQLRAARP